MRVGLRIALGADHAGVVLKDNLARLLEERGIAYKDFGTHGSESVDYPDFAAALGARLTPPDVASDIVSAFLDTPFEGGRHQRRIDKLTHLDFPTPERKATPERKQRD